MGGDARHTPSPLLDHNSNAAAEHYTSTFIADSEARLFQSILSQNEEKMQMLGRSRGRATLKVHMSQEEQISRPAAPYQEPFLSVTLQHQFFAVWTFCHAKTTLSMSDATSSSVTLRLGSDLWEVSLLPHYPSLFSSSSEVQMCCSSNLYAYAEFSGLIPRSTSNSTSRTNLIDFISVHLRGKCPQ